MHLTEKDAERFWKHVERRGGDECWLWKASFSTTGYGQFGAQGKILGAHRVAYYLHYGMWPEVGRHTCGHAACCNPKHIIDPAAPTRAPLVRLAALHRQSRHTDAEIRHIRELYAGGKATQAQLAEQADASQVWIGQVVRGECRKKAGGPITALGRGRRAA